MNGTQTALPVPVAEYYEWLSSVGMYAGKKQLTKHCAVELFTKMYIGIDLVESNVFSVETDNPLIGASVNNVFCGSIIDLLNVQIIEAKAVNKL